MRLDKYIRTPGIALAAGTALFLGCAAPLSVSAYAQEPSVTEGTAPAPLTSDELEVLVARIALYPDDLVAVITSASLYPLQIVEAARFLEAFQKDKTLKPREGWDGSIVSLLNYPDIVKMMSDDLDWTQALGSVLAYQQKDVLIAIQQLREKAVADGIIKTDDKVKVETRNDNVVIQAANPEKVYVPQYPPEMLYEPGYVPVPVAYYPDPYPNYYYPTATFFAATVTGAVWAAAVDWDDWGVWGGHWDGDIDIDCNKCFNNIDIDGKFKLGDIDWKNVDRSKIRFDKSQFARIDRATVRNDFKSVKDNNIANRAKMVRKDGIGSVQNQVGRISVDDVRKSRIDARQRIGAGKPDISAGNRRAADAIKSRPAVSGKVGDVKPANRTERQISKPKLGGKIERSGGSRPSALGRVENGKVTKVHSDRGRQALGGGKPHRQIKRGGGRHR